MGLPQGICMEDRQVTKRTNAVDSGSHADTSPARRRPGRPTLSNEQLLDAALDLFCENGFERTSIDAITAAAGMAKRTVYARYGDKTTLFKAALTRAIEQWIVPVDALRAAESEDLEETLLDIGRILVTNVLRSEGQRLLRLTNAVSGQMPEIGAFNVENGTRPTLAYLAELLGRRLGLDAEEAADAAEAYLDLVVGGTANAGARGVTLDDVAVTRHTEYCVRLFLRGILPRGETSGADGENQRLKTSIADALSQLEQVRHSLERALAGA